MPPTLTAAHPPLGMCSTTGRPPGTSRAARPSPLGGSRVAVAQRTSTASCGFTSPSPPRSFPLPSSQFPSLPLAPRRSTAPTAAVTVALPPSVVDPRPHPPTRIVPAHHPRCRLCRRSPPHLSFCRSPPHGTSPPRSLPASAAACTHLGIVRQAVRAVSLSCRTRRHGCAVTEGLCCFPLCSPHSPPLPAPPPPSHASPSPGLRDGVHHQRARAGRRCGR